MNQFVKLALLALVTTPCAFGRAQAQAVDNTPRINMEVAAPVRAVARDTTKVIVGTFARQVGDTLVLHRALGTTDTTVFLSNLVRIDEQAHPFNTAATRQGAIIGGVVGLVAGILVVRQLRSDCDRTLMMTIDGQSSCAYFYSLLPDFVAAGAGLGFGLAWVSERPRWQLRWSAPLP